MALHQGQRRPGPQDPRRTSPSPTAARPAPAHEPKGRPWPIRTLAAPQPPAASTTRRYEHDACGVGLVADLQGRRATIWSPGADRARTARPPGRLGGRGGHRRRGRHPDPGAAPLSGRHRRTPASSSPSRGLRHRARVPPQDPDAAAKARSQLATIAEEEGLRVLGWRACRSTTRPLGETAGGSARIEQSSWSRPRGRRPHGARPARLLRPQAGRAHRRRPYFPSLSPRTLVYKGMLTAPTSSRSSSPTSATSGSSPRSPWCTRASPPTPSRPGRSRTRTACSPTTARSTR